MASPTSTAVAAGSPLTTGGVLTGPVGTAMPTDSTTALNAAFLPLGYAGDDGVQPSGDAPSVNDIVAWGGDIIASLRENKGTVKFTFTLLSYFDSDLNKLLYGASNVTVTAASSSAGTKLAIQDKGDQIAIQPWVFDMFYAGKTVRLAAPRGSLVVTQEKPFVHTDLMGYECELSCLPDSSSVRLYRYLGNDNKTV